MEMTKSFEELDHRETQLGELILRRRRIPMLGDEVVYEVILNGEFLMSSLFHAVEEALADLGLAVTPPGPLDVLVGGLGLGYTAAAALRHPNVSSLSIVEYLGPVIEWHGKGLVQLGAELTGDPRTCFIETDFFASATRPREGFDPMLPGRKFHAILLDIDHSPRHWLNPRHSALYSREGLTTLGQNLHKGGVFAMWSDESPDEEFLFNLREVFTEVHSHVISFPNPIRGGESSGTVYVAQKQPTWENIID